MSDAAYTLPLGLTDNTGGGEDCRMCGNDGWLPLVGRRGDYDRGSAPCRWCRLGHRLHLRYPRLEYDYAPDECEPVLRDGRGPVPSGELPPMLDALRRKLLTAPVGQARRPPLPEPASAFAPSSEGAKQEPPGGLADWELE